MARIGLALIAFAIIGAAPAAADDYGNPSIDWNGHLGFISPTQQQVDLNQADMIKRAKQGYYGQWNVDQHNTNITNNYGDTNIGTANTSNAIGSQNVNTVSVDGFGNTVSQDTTNSSSNTGATGAQTNAPSNNTGDYSSSNN